MTFRNTTRHIRQQKHVTKWMQPRKIKINIFLTCITRLYTTETKSQRRVAFIYHCRLNEFSSFISFFFSYQSKKRVTNDLWMNCSFIFVNYMSIVKKNSEKNIKRWQHNNRNDNKIFTSMHTCVLLQYLFVISDFYCVSLHSFFQFSFSHSICRFLRN